jgi:hypothetical protein
LAQKRKSANIKIKKYLIIRGVISRVMVFDPLGDLELGVSH